MPYTETDTHAPLTDAYIARMERRDNPLDHEVCEHNVEILRERCPDCVWQPAFIATTTDYGVKDVKIVTPEEFIEMRRPK